MKVLFLASGARQDHRLKFSKKKLANFFFQKLLLSELIVSTVVSILKFEVVFTFQLPKIDLTSKLDEFSVFCQNWPFWDFQSSCKYSPDFQKKS